MGMIEQQKNLEVFLFSNATSNKRAMLQNRMQSGNEHALPYGKEAAMEIAPVAKEYIYEQLGTVLNKKIFLKKYLNPEHQLYLHECETLNKKERKWKEDPVELIANAVTVILVSSISTEMRLTSLLNKCCRSINHILWIPFGEAEEVDKHTIKFLLGMIKHITNNSDVFVLESRNNREKVIRVTEAWFEHIQEARSNLDTDTDAYAPMICEPNKHKTLVGGNGGYLEMDSPLIKRPFRDLLTKKIHPLLLEFNDTNYPEFFKEVNRFQSIPYTVNRKLYNVISYFYSNGKFFNKHPIDIEQCRNQRQMEADEIIDKRNRDIKERSERLSVDYKPLSRDTERKIISQCMDKAYSEVNKTKALFEQVEFYGGYDKLYFPFFYDFRGRRYPYSNYGLSYMGDELQKSMLEFANKEKLTITGVKNLFYTLSNTLGFDKEDRLVKGMKAVRWYESNKHIFKSNDFSMFFDRQEEFEEPINALAVVLELLEYEKDSSYKCGYIAHRDARCSGSSIIGSLLGDKEVMRLTSVLEEVRSERLPDAYMTVANTAKVMCENMKVESSEKLMKFSDLLFSRSVFKKPVMCKLSYGLTDYSVRKDNTDMFEDNNLFEYLDKKDKRLYDLIMLRSLDIAMPSCKQFLNKTRDIAKDVCSINNGLIAYQNPFTGFPVVYRVYNEEEYQLKAPTGYQELSIIMRRKVNTTDRIKTVNGFSPNSIHNWDSTLLVMAGQQFKHDYTTIHDSIGTHPNNCDEMRKCYNRSMVMLNKMSPLDSICEQLGTTIRYDVNILPNHDSILNSKHSLA